MNLNRWENHHRKQKQQQQQHNEIKIEDTHFRSATQADLPTANKTRRRSHRLNKTQLSSILALSLATSAFILLPLVAVLTSSQQFPVSPYQTLEAGDLLAAHQRMARYAPPPVGGYSAGNRIVGSQLVQSQLLEYNPKMRWKQDKRQPQTILPYEGYKPNGTEVSYVIENKRFVEAVNSRCWTSTALEDPMLVEPSFIIIRPQTEVRLNATAPALLIRLAGFDPKLSTRILIHGFTQSYPSTAWLRRIRALHEKHQLMPARNLIIMDWGAASQGSYAQVAGMVSGMGSFLANFLMKLLELGADRNRIHIIGHSLGAHLAGFAGKRIKPRIGRITALDPAGPCFGKFFSNSAQDRLEANDAYEVDVYHYDDSFLGLPGQHGHFDIYVNGGSSQPGCTNNVNAMFQALLTMILKRDRVLSESHTRSTEVPTCELATTNCQQVAYECRDYAAFTAGECGRCDNLNNQCFLMGFEHQYSSSSGLLEQPLRTSHPGKRLYIQTGTNNELFCQHHYQILVKFEPSPEMALAAKRNKWRLYLDLLTDRREHLNVTMSNQMAPNVFSYLLLTEAPPFRFIGARLQVRGADGGAISLTPPTLQWPSSSSSSSSSSSHSTTNSKSTFWPFAMEINFMSNIDPEVRRLLSSRLCPLAATPFSLLVNNNQIDSPAHTNWLQFDECLAISPAG